MLVMAFGGRKTTGEKFIIGETIAGGSGACADRDGVDVIETDATNCMNIPAEAIEMDAPIRVHRVALRSDSGGAGRFRGGLGIVREYEMLDDQISFSHRGERHFSAPLGVDGGNNGAMAHSVILRADGSEEIIPSKVVTWFAKGDRLIVETAGGGGYGAALDREKGAVQTDIDNGKISQDEAAEKYGFHLQPLARA